MTRPDGLDQLLEHELSRAVSQIHGDDGLTRTLVDGSVTRLRRHQRRVMTTATLTTSLAILATGIVGWQLQSGSSDAGPSIHVPAVAPTYHYHRSYSPLGAAATWALSLPRGADTTEPFVAGSRLFEGRRVVELGPNAHATLDAQLPGGWLAEYSSRVDGQGNQIDRQTGFLDVNGQFRAFAFSHKPGSKHQALGTAASPDGSRVTYGGRIVDVATGKQVRLLPPRAKYVYAWARLGIAYLDSSGQQMLWTPGSPPRRTAWEFESAVTATQSAKSCTRIGHLGDDGIIHPLATFCGDAAGAVSDTGLTVTYSGKVVDLTTGQVLGRIPVTAPMDGISLAECCEMFWSSDGHLLVTVWTGSEITRAEYLLVSCQTTDGRLSCSRATDPLSAYPFPALSLLAP